MMSFAGDSGGTAPPFAMTSTEVDRHVVLHRWWRDLEHAALDYANQGRWPLLPGPLITNPSPPIGAQPVLPPEYASVDPTMVRRWWVDGPFTVLTLVGRCFEVITAPILPALSALDRLGAEPMLTPVLLVGQTVGFLVRTGSTLLAALAGHDVRLCASGEPIALPPSPTAAGQVRWLVHPADAHWRPGDAGPVQRALLAAITTTRTP